MPDACASLWIESARNPKQIQTLIGHSSIKVTFDTYGHLFADAEGDQRAAADMQLNILMVFRTSNPRVRSSNLSERHPHQGH
jgi:hypothetical protein